MKLLQEIMAVVAIATVLWAGAAAAQTVTFTKDAPLRSEPRFDAAPVAQVIQGTSGEASAKQGPWLNIKTAGGAGWALTTDINFGTSAGASSGGSTGSLFGRPRQASTTSTIGIRGFDKETIGNAFGGGGAVSSAQLALLDGYAVDKDGGQNFASAQGLTAVSVKY